MALKELWEVSVGGPDGQGTWGDEGDSFTLQNHSTISMTTTAPGAFPAQTVTRVNTALPGQSGGPLPGTLAAGAAIQTISGFQCSNGQTAMAAASNVNFGIRVTRNIGLGVALTNTTITSFVPGAPLLAPIPSGASIYFTNPTGTTFTAVTSALVPAGSTIVPVTSVSTGAAFPVGAPGAMAGTSVVLAVGGLGTQITNATPQVPSTGDLAFGWLVSGAGTPVFPANSSVLMPALAANIAVVNGMLPMAASDNIQVYLITTSSTFTMQVMTIQPLLV